MERKRWKTVLAKLLIVTLLMQLVPFLQGGAGTAYAEEQNGGTVMEEVYGGEPVQPVEPAAGAAAAPQAMQFTAASMPSDKITDYTWERMSLNLSPDARQAAAMAYDENAGNVVMFGGQGDTGLLDDTWIWDGGQKTWHEELLSTVPKPSKRKGAVMAYDTVSQKVLLFGGEGASGVLNDTWLWNGTAAQWEQVTGLSASPPARAGAQLAFDGRQLVLFGGYTGSGSSKTPLGDTWLWDGSAWTQVQPAQSPPAAYDGKMSFDGKTAVLYGGNTGSVTNTYQSTGTNETKTLSHDDSSALLWKWDPAAQTWSSVNGPEGYGRWGQVMAYDGRRVVIFSGERDYVHMNNAVLVEGLKLPSTMYPLMSGSLAYGWNGSSWQSYPRTVSMEAVYQSNKDKDGKEYVVQTVPNQLPFPISYASMAFDGKNFVVFGGNRNQISILDKVFGSVVGAMPAGNVNETWVFGYTPPTAPGVKFDVDPVIHFDPQHIHDTVSVITNVYSDGTRAITSRGVEYRPYTEAGDGTWTQVPYTDSASTGTGTFTVTLSGLTWHQEYETRGYAANELGISYTETKRFVMKDDPNMTPPDVHYDRVGASVLHVKDKKRLVAVGTGITNLLRKPLTDIHYYLQSQNGTRYELKYNLLNDRQLELTWTDELPPGKYNVQLEHDFYNDRVFTEGLLVTALDFYKPRNFARVEVPSTSAGNEVNSVVLQGPFTEDPSAPNVYVLNDTSETVTINGSLLFKGSRLVVDKNGPNGKAAISGEGRLYVNGGGTLGANVSYTIQDGPFTISSDNFSITLNSSEATDYLNSGMPVKASSLVFAKDGLRLTGDLQIGVQVGSQKVTDTVPVQDMTFRNNRFDLFGTFTMNNSIKVGPFNASDTKFVLDTRIPYMAVSGKGNLPDTNLSFDMYMKTKQGRLDGVSFGMYRKTKLASTGLQVNYLFGSVDKLAEKTQIPQKFSVTGSVNDVIVPELKHPQVDYRFNLIGTDSVNMDVSSYGFNASGTEYYYWLPVNNMSMQSVVNPAAAGIKGFSTPGFATKGEVNVFEVVKGAIGTYSFNKKGFNGAIKGTVYVPKGIPRIGGAVVRDVAFSVNETGIYGTLRHNGVGAHVKYTFNNNTILFEVEAEPPKKKWWEKGLDFMNSVSDFMDAAEPWLDLAEELFLVNPDSGKQVTIASADALKRVFNLQPVSLSVQPEDTAQTDVKVRIVDGQLTALDRTPLMTTEANASGGQVTNSFAVNRAFNALIALTGDQRSAVLKTPAVPGQRSEQIVQAAVFYDAASDTTFMRVSLYAGNWKLVTNGSSRIRVNELLFAKESLTLGILAGLWVQSPERSVTSITMEERGSYLLKIGAAQGEVVVYKPDGRPYSLQTAQNQPDWNAYRDANGNLYALLDAVEAGTWMISAGTSPSAVLNSVPPQTTIGEVVQWGQVQAYPTAFQMSRTNNGQAIVEIYGADPQTKLYAPSGELYTLQLDPNQSGMNAIYDESQQKLTILLDGADLSGQWKAVGSSFTSVVAYQSSRKLKSIKPLLMEGRFSKYFELAENGSYLLTVIGGNANTVITAPDGTPYTLNFDAPNGNAYLQPAADRIASAGASGDPLQQTQIDTPNPVKDGRDTLYVSLLNAPAGKWTIQNAKKVDLQIQKLNPLPAIKASVSPVSGAENRIQVTWSMENAAPDAEVTVMLTDSADQFIGEVIADGLAASGSTIIDVPGTTMPGTYHLSVAGTSAGRAPVYAMAEGTVEVTAPYTLHAPERPEVLSTGNGEVSLRFSSLPGNVTAYRVWVSKGTDGQAASPVMDFAPQSGNSQVAVVSGLSAGASYTIAVSAIGQEQGRLVLSPQSPGVTLELPVPQPAAVTVLLDAGSHAVSERSYTAMDGNEETLLLTSAEQASLQATTDQNATLTLSVNGLQLGRQQVSAGAAYAFKLHELLNVSELKEREYNLLIEAVNERGDRSLVYRKLFVDRTGPLLIASGGDDPQGNSISLNGTVTADSKVLITGQTDVGAKLDINGVIVPVDDGGRFVYYAPLDWVTQADRNQITVTASDEIGNKTEYGFEVLRDTAGTIPTYSGDLAALALNGAKMDTPYEFSKASYQALAYSEKVRVYAVPMAAASMVTIDGQELPESGYVDVEAPASGRIVQIRVQSDNAADKLYTIQIDGTGSSVAGLRTLKLNNATAAPSGEELAAQTFTGAEESYTVYVDHTVDSVTLRPGALKAGSDITVNGLAVQSGQASQPIQLQAGENRIPVTVISPDGSQTRSYQVSVWREPSSNALLRELGLATAGAELVSGFHPAALNYQVLVPYATEAFTLLPVTEQSDAAIRIDGQAVTKGTALSIPFNRDAQTYTIEVTAQDGTPLTYTVSVLRQQALPARPPLLASMQADPVLDHAFTPYKLKYGTLGTTDRNYAAIKAIPNDPQATVTVQGKSLKGGGIFSPDLVLGDNTIIVSVESADLTVSQMYSIDVERVSESSEESNVRQTPISGAAGGWTDQTSIVRTRSGEGKTIDTVRLDVDKARAILEKAAQNKDGIARIYVTDVPDAPADERIVSLGADTVTLLADGGMSLQIVLPDAQLALPAASLKQLSKDGKDAYFRVVPVRADAERSEVTSRVLAAELVQNAAGGQPVAVTGQPVKIETNYSGYTTELLFPLNHLMLPDNEAEAKQILSELAVYIEHSDGDKALSQGEIRYDAEGKLAGIAIEVNKFSTFTIIQKNETEASEVIEPYLSGYPDGTFRPSQSITRAELAMILHRVLTQKTSGGGASLSAQEEQAAAAGYADVPASHWAADAISRIQRSGLMVGDNNGLFRPNDAVSRGELATIASRVLSVAKAGDIPASGYSDVEGHWAFQAIIRASAAGILQGYPDGTFLPDHELNRAEAVKVLNRLFERPVSEGPLTSRWPDVPEAHWALKEIESASSKLILLPDGRAHIVPSR